MIVPPLRACCQAQRARAGGLVASALLAGVLGPGLAIVAALCMTTGANADDQARSSPAAKAAYTAAAALQNRAAWDLAADAWEGLLRDHPRDALAPKARYYLGLCRVEEGNWPAAEKAFAAVLEGGGADAETMALARFELGRGRFAVAQARRAPEAFGEAAEALRDYLEGTKTPTQAAEASYLLAESLWQSGDRPAAVETWERFIREQAKSPRLAEVLYSLGLAQAEEGLDSAATATLRTFAERYPDHPLAAEVAIRRADLALAAGEPAAAAKLVVELARDKDSPRGSEALERLGTALWRQKRYPAAGAAYDMLAARSEESAKSNSALLSSSAAWLEAAKPDEARKRLEQIVAKGGDSADEIEAAARLARLRLAAGDADAALDIAQRALDKAGPAGTPEKGYDPGTIPRLRLIRAEALLERPDGREACLGALAELLLQCPDAAVVAPALALQSALLLESGKASEAVAAADRYLALPQEGHGEATLDVRAIRAEAILSGGNPAAAVEAWRGIVAEAQGDHVPHWMLRMGAAQIAARAWGAAHVTLGPLATAAAGSSNLAADEVPECLLLDATALVELDRAKEALPLIDRIARDHQSWQRQAEATLLGIRARRESGDFVGALELAETLVANGPGEGIAERAWFRLGQARQDAGKPAEAIAAYAEARRVAPAGPYAAAGLLAEGSCREAIDDRSGAEAVLSDLIERFPESAACVPALLARGDLRQRSGDPAAGLADAQRVIAIAAAGDARGKGEADAEARFLAGICHAAAGRPAAAIEVFTGLLSAHRDFPATDRVLLELGMAQSAAGDGAAAEATFADIRTRFPGSPRVAEALLETGEIRFTAADWEGAATAYADLLARPPGDAEALLEQARHKRAWTFAMRQDHTAAADAFAAQLAAHAEGPCAADGRVMLGDSLCRLGKFDEAAAVLAPVLAEPGGISSADLFGLATVRGAECEAKRERWDESFALIDRWLAARGGGDQGEAPAPGTIAQARFARAWALQNLSRLDEALLEFRSLADEGLGAGEATGRGPTELAARARLMEGEVLFEQERHKEAIAAFFKVAYGFGDRKAPAVFQPWQAQASFEAARCFEVLGKPDQARDLYAELVERYPQSPHVAAARKRLDALPRAAK